TLDWACAPVAAKAPAVAAKARYFFFKIVSSDYNVEIFVLADCGDCGPQIRTTTPTADERNPSYLNPSRRFPVSLAQLSEFTDIRRKLGVGYAVSLLRRM
ncbi:hypothetical protein, partial [Paraburkholderia nemoris]|uniref:hypothetical protein n=1 Tax=Paraburkholderia nemoris TaxID=2793076 RepID=UPI001B8BBBA6